MPKPIQNRIHHYWTPRAIKQIDLLLRPISDRPHFSCTVHLTPLQFAISESSLIKTLPLPTTSPSYLKSATCTFATSVEYALGWPIFTWGNFFEEYIFAYPLILCELM